MIDYQKYYKGKVTPEQWARELFNISPNYCIQSTSDHLGVYWNNLMGMWICHSCDLPLSRQN